MSKPILVVVDDDPDMADIIQYVAEEIGFEVRAAFNAIDFQKIWHETEPTAIVLDIVMPDIDGNELLQWLVEEGCSVPILLVSGYDGKYLRSAESLGKNRGAPIVGTLRKPFAVDDVSAKLKQIIETTSLWSDNMSVGVEILDADH
jgi:DNA-binding response OmpR family regulator